MKKLLLFLLLALTLQAHADNSVLTKPNLKILMLGNSYMLDGTTYLKDLANANGSDISDMCIYRILRSSSGFKHWCDIYNDKDVYEYYFARELGGLSSTVKQGKGEAGDGSLFRQVLTDDEWDLILIQPVSTEAADYDKWENDGYLAQLLEILKTHQPNAQIGFVMVHSYWDEYVHNYQHSSYDRWQLIADATQQLAKNYDIDFVLPCGTAVENLRMTSVNNDYDLTRDGTQMAYGLGRYVASCCYYEALIAPRSGISVTGNTLRPTVSSSTSSTYPIVAVTDENAALAQRAAVLAVSDPYVCHNPENEDDVPGTPESVSLTITNTQGDGTGVATFSAPYDLDFSEVEANVKAYIAAGYNAGNGKITAVRAYDAPAGTGLLVKGTAGTYEIPCRPSLSYFTSMLVGTPEKTWVTKTDGVFTNFILSRVNGQIGFRPLSNDGYVNAGKAYLQIPTQLLNTASANQVGIVYEDEAEDPTDGISDISAADTDDAYYTLSGIKVARTQKGVYIHHGKKVVVR